jgi:alpha-methylacyl-CoA racemase
MSGPLAGLKVVEMVGIGPAPFCAMLLADMGADVIRIDRPGGNDAMKIVAPRFDTTARGRRSIALNLKKAEATRAVLDLVAKAEVLIEGFRPGVMERLGLGPEVCLAQNPRLVFARLTGWGQNGPLAQAAGHDINYIALAGVLHTIGHADAPPVPPMNLVGDMGGGGMLLAFGVMCAVHEAQRSGKGQVVDASMVDGSALLATMNWGFKEGGYWRNERGVNLNDGAAHYYGSYECADGKYVCIGSVEPQFYARLRQLAGLDDPSFDAHDDYRRWPELKARMTEVFKTKTRAQWCELMEGSDVCFSPVLDWNEAPRHPHNEARGTFIQIDGVTQPAPAPRFSRTPASRPLPPSVPGADTESALRDWGFGAEAITALRAAGAIA